MRKGKMKLSEIAEAVPVSAIDALRKNLLYAMLKTVSEGDMQEIVGVQVDKAKGGDTKSAKLIIDMLNATTTSNSREEVVREQGGIVDYKLEVRKLIACLIAFNGPQDVESIAARLHLTGSVAMDALMCGWFTKDGQKWTLTNEARTKFLDVSVRVLTEEHIANRDVE